MKPIRLEFSGLNSYRGSQAVDFEKLGADGLFGIFGPTGSGKSSILDAITLALYGSVDRASNNTRGIINQLEKTLDVSFRFELGGEVYLVERRYERKGKDPDTAEAKLARLRRLAPGGENVLAGNPREVNAKIQEILGIGYDEFTRAVILPQGKFDQFLRLKGAERARMLEHLFNLEEYGDELAARVKAVSAKCETELTGIEGEEQGLGDCSEEAVAQAGQALQDKARELGENQAKYNGAEQAFKDAEALRGLYQKKQAALEKRNELERQREAIAGQEARLSAAERAEPLRESIERRRELGDAIKDQTAQLQIAEAKRAEAAKKHEEARVALARAEKESEEEQPVLHKRQAQLQEAVEKDARLRELRQALESKRKEHEAAAKAAGAAERETAAVQEELTGIRTALAPLNESREKLTVDPAEKETIEQALEALRLLEDVEKRLKDASETHNRRRSHVDERWNEIVTAVRERMPDREIAPGEDLEALADSVLSKAAADLEEARVARQRALMVNSASALANELRDGEPCPVCGSHEHPQPARISSEELDRCEAAVKEAQAGYDAAIQWQGRILKLWHDWSNNEPLAREAQTEMEKARLQAMAALAEFESLRGPYDREGLRRRKKDLAEAEKELHALEAKRGDLLTRQDILQERLRDLAGQSQAAKVKETALAGELKNIQTQAEDLDKELAKITGGRDLSILIRETGAALAALQQALDKAKRDEAAARDALGEIDTNIAALKAALQTNQKTLAGIDGRLAAGLKETGYAAADEAEAALLPPAEREAMRREIDNHRKAVAVAENDLQNIEMEINGRPFDEAWFEQVKARRDELAEALKRANEEAILAKNRVEELQAKQGRWRELEERRAQIGKRKALADDLAGLLRGRAFVNFLAQEHLRDMAMDASRELGRLTGQRYALEHTAENDFVIRDDYNGGHRRAVASLSGGEIFLASLALALALSSRIQLRGRYPLGFFFLDEGFGSLDGEKLDKVMSALEKLHDRNRMVGVISHVKEMRERLPRYLEVVGAGEDGGGSEIRATAR
ncbi:MAG: AAA family ATPase [Patescibacteria group bacterium]